MALVRLLFITFCGSLMVVSEESRIAIQSRKGACKNLGGKCIKRKKDCPNRLPMETQPGSPYCNKRRRCCYLGCPDDGVIVAGQCLTFSTGRLSWDDAKDNCSSRGGGLASLVRPTTFLNYAGFKYGVTEWWLGGARSENDEWVWLNGQPFGDDFPWIASEPNNEGGDENCLQTFSGRYNDRKCSIPRGFVCEFGTVEGSVVIEATDGMEVYWETLNYDGTIHYPEGYYCYTNNITITTDYDMFMVNMEMVGPASIYRSYDCKVAYIVYTNADGETSNKHCGNLSGRSWEEIASFNTPRHFSFKFCSYVTDKTDIGFRMKITGKDLKQR